MARAKKTPAVAAPNALFPDLPFNDPEEVKTQQQKQADAGPSNADLLKMIDGLRAQLDRSNAANAALMAQPMVAVPPKVRTEIDLKALPDPVTEPEKYAQELARQTQEIQQGVKVQSDFQSQQQQTLNDRIAGLWEKFGKAHKDYAKDPAKVEFIASKVIQEKARQGLDTSKYMFLATDTFMDDVTKAYDDAFGKPVAEGQEEEEKPGQQQQQADDEDDGRTAGIFGGLDSGGKPVHAIPGSDDDMFKDVREWQMKTGFSR